MITTAKETVRRFCQSWFEQRDAEKTLTFLSEDVRFVGTGEDESAQGSTEMAAYLRQDIQEIPEPFHFELADIHEQRIAEHVCSLAAGLILKNTLYSWRLRAFFTLVQTKGGECLIKLLGMGEQALG